MQKGCAKRAVQKEATKGVVVTKADNELSSFFWARREDTCPGIAGTFAGDI